MTADLSCPSPTNFLYTLDTPDIPDHPAENRHSDGLTDSQGDFGGSDDGDHEEREAIQAIDGHLDPEMPEFLRRTSLNATKST